MIKLNDEVVESGRFPNGETYIKLDVSVYNNYQLDVELYFESNDDLINLMMLKGHIDKHFPSATNTLEIKYMPYSRMDREIEPFVFSLKYVSDFINMLGFNRVIVLEPHSNVSTALLNNCFFKLTSVDVVCSLAENIKFDVESDYILYPDAGAQKRYQDEFKDLKTLVGYKKRDLQSGKIISFHVDGDEDLKGANVIICDDLCSKGGTFLATAKALQSRNVGDIYLAVTHLENTVNTGSLPKSELIKGVFATNSIYTDEPFEKLTLVEVI